MGDGHAIPAAARVRRSTTVSTRQRTIRLVVRSDRRLFRDALIACLATQPGYHIVGHVSHLDDLVTLCRLRRPDVAIVDIGTGSANLAPLRECGALAKVMVVYEALSPGQYGALSQFGIDTMLPYSHGLAPLLTVLRGYAAEEAPAATDGITERERRIISLVAAGHTVDQIARLLELSCSSVAKAKHRIYHKLQVSSQGEAMARAAVLGIVPPCPAYQPPNGHPAGSPVATLRGTAGQAWQSVTHTLVTAGLPFTSDHVHHAGSPVLLLVDPADDDWLAGLDGGLPVVLVRTVPPTRAEALDALMRGARTVLSAHHVATALVPALVLARHGHVTVEAGAARAMVDAVRRTAGGPGLPELTTRELDILASIGLGHTVRQTARTLGIAVKTVENTQSRLFRKLGARNRAVALVTAHSLGLLELARGDDRELLVPGQRTRRTSTAAEPAAPA